MRIQEQDSPVLREWQQELSGGDRWPGERSRSGDESEERIRNLSLQCSRSHGKILIRQLILVEIRNRSPSLQKKMCAPRSRVCHRKGRVLADLPFNCRVPLLHIWHFVARRAHGKDALTVEVRRGCASP